MNFKFFQSLDSKNIEMEAINLLLKNFLDGWLFDKKFNNRYCFGFVDSLLDLIWIGERMAAAKNMNATTRSIFWARVDISNKNLMSMAGKLVQKKTKSFGKHL